MKKKWILAAFGLSGTAALIYEVTWTRALSLVFGSTTYALSSMLSTFMAGLALGGYIGGKLADTDRDPVRLFAFCEAGIGIFGLLTIPMIYAIPTAYLHLHRLFHMDLALFLEVQLFLAAAVMIVPTTLMGMSFPLVSRAIAGEMGEIGRTVGNAYAVNTLGAIAGALSGGFILIPHLGLKITTFFAAGMNLAIALLVLLLLGGSRRVIAGLGMFVLMAGSVSAWSEEKTTFVTFYTLSRFQNIPPRYLLQKNKMGHELLYYKEFPEGAVRLYRERDGYLVLQTGGKMEGTTKEDMPNTLLLAYLPIASHRNPGSFLTIGLGAGVTLMAAKEHIKDTGVIEINPGVAEAIGRYGPPGIFEGVDVHIDDARRHFIHEEKRYDIISSEPSYPAESAVANLFTREYYELAKNRLLPGGIYCQWLPYYTLTNDDVTMMLKTIGSVFKNVYLWKVGDSFDLIAVASVEPFPFTRDETIKRVAALNKSGIPLEISLSRDPQQVREIVERSDVAINTDDLPLLEFNTVNNIIRGIND